MNNNMMEWRDEYNVGVEYIDKAHKELFSVIYKFQEIIGEKTEDYKKSLCISMLRYLTKYTYKHFEEEEIYMLQKKYPGYGVHKNLHDNLKKHTLPYLSKMLEDNKYSDDAIARLIAVLSGWLSSHIIIEDRAITDKTISKWHHDDYNGGVISLIDQEFRLFAEDLFSIEAKLVNNHYEGEYIGTNVYKFYYSFAGPERKYTALFLCDGSFVKYGVDRLTNHMCDELSDIALAAFSEIAKSWSKAAISLLDDADDFEITCLKIDQDPTYGGFFIENTPLQSLIWQAGSYHLGIVINQHSTDS